MCRNPLVLASLVISAGLIWWNTRTVVPQWQVWDVQLGSTLLAVAAAVLVTAQLAAGRVRRDGMRQLYDSYPAPASVRVGAHLLGLAGPLLAAAALAGAAVVWLDRLGAVGTPRPAVLAQGLLLVALGGAIGVALGSWLPHPMTGLLTVIVLGAAETDILLPVYDVPVQLPPGTTWLFPWAQPTVLHWLPGTTSAVPPASHLAWLTALTVLAVIAALWRVFPRDRPARLTGLAAVATAGCLAVTGWSGWAQTRPVPVSVQEALLYQLVRPAQSERCTSQERVRYCAYPGYQPNVARWETVVNGVLGRLPARPTGALVVRQVADSSFMVFDLSSSYLLPITVRDRRLRALVNEFNRFEVGQTQDPHLVPGSSMPPVYVDMSWGRGSATGPYQLGLAMQVAWWVAGLPTTQRSVAYGPGPNAGYFAQISCLPVGQAREAIALWLAISATPAAQTAFLTWPSQYRGSAGPGYFTPNKVGGHWVSSYTPAVEGYLPAITYTGQGAALAEAMLRLPPSRIQAVLAARWPGWLSPQATDAQLAAALGLRLPAATPPPMSAVNQGQPLAPVCR
jgi:hypothetical protein